MSLQEVEVQDKQGSWYRVQVRPYRTRDNRIDGAVVALIDITALKLAAQEISNARDDALTIIEAMPNPGLVITSDRRVQTANQSFYATFQLKQSETTGRFLSELSAGQWSIPKLLKMVDAVLNSGAQFKDLEIDADFPVIGRRHLVINARRADLTGVGLQAALVAIEDATERKELSHKLELAEARHRIFLENAYNGILVISQKGIIEFANRRAEIQFGYSPGELRGQSYEILIPDQGGSEPSTPVAPSSCVIRKTSRLAATSMSPCKAKDGSLLPVEISLSPLTVDSEVLITAFILDISERKKQQLETERANRMRDEFLAVLSHELRTPLTNILAWSQLLLLETGDREKTLKGIAAIEKSANEQRQLIDDLLDVARIQAGKMHLEFSDVDPADCVSSAVDSVRTLADKRSLTIETKLEPSSRITADQGRLQASIPESPDECRSSSHLQEARLPFN
jgi:two-component system CheB/CheR fusion protein